MLEEGLGGVSVLKGSREKRKASQRISNFVSRKFHFYPRAIIIAPLYLVPTGKAYLGIISKNVKLFVINVGYTTNY